MSRVNSKGLIVHTRLELLINRFAIVSTGWKTISSAIPADPAWISREHQMSCLHCVPDPSNLAMPDSLLYSFPAAPTTGAIAGGDMLLLCPHVRIRVDVGRV